MATNLRHAFGGILVAAFGMFVVAHALTYPMGTLARMGPGYFPMLLGLLLLLLGLGIAFVDVRAERTGPGTSEALPFPWHRLRAVGLLTISPLAFAALIEPAGLVPAVFSAVFISTFADSTATFARGLLLSCGLTLASVLIFKVGLNLPFDLIG